MQTSTAIRSQRVTAALINLVIGGLPVVIPNMVFPASEPSLSWTRMDVNLLAAGLTTIQLILVHIMQGSPGTIFAGLKVQNLDGSKPLLTTTLVRSIPYLIMVAVIMAKRGGGSANFPDPLALIAMLTILFLGLSGVALIVTGRHSLLDLVTKTAVVKAYTIGK